MKRRPIDFSRVERAAAFLAQGATIEPRDGGMVRLILNGEAVMLTDRAILEEAQRPSLPALDGRP